MKAAANGKHQQYQNENGMAKRIAIYHGVASWRKQ
jgi:hypothetical protein